jgi:broad specificity phosphatase PhoE
LRIPYCVLKRVTEYAIRHHASRFTHQVMRLILVRHGESEHGRRRLIAGRSGCLGLTERGKEQAAAVAGRLRASGEFGEGVRLLTSPVLRAWQTAERIAVALGVEAAVDDGLREVEPGAADGMAWEAYVEQYGAFDMVAEPERPFAPGGESWLDFTGRVGATMARLGEQLAGQTVVAVTHGGFIVVAMLVLFAIPRPGTRAYLEPGYTSLTEWRFGEGVWRLERYNDTCHL